MNFPEASKKPLFEGLPLVTVIVLAAIFYPKKPDERKSQSREQLVVRLNANTLRRFDCIIILEANNQGTAKRWERAGTTEQLRGNPGFMKWTCVHVLFP